ncbi:MAG: dihydroorotase [Clostridia bacterium]|nr:dihydroorotase [Clostridia bacterium]
MDDCIRRADVAVEGDHIAAVASTLPVSPDDVCYDLKGYFLCPGLLDVHVHLREPGFSYKETIATGTLAAAKGGYTAVCAMPNVDPSPDDAASLAEQLRLIREQAVIDVLPYGTITRGERGEQLSDMEALAPQVIAFSDDGHGVQSEDMMRQAMLKAKSLGKIIVAHCEDNTRLHGGYIHDGAYAKAHGHRGISSESEWKPIERDLRLVRETGAAYHVCHVSTKESVALIRAAKEEGLPVTCETAPHYLLLTEDDLIEDGRFKMNPPLRTQADRQALLDGLRDGTVDMIATDHAPHSAEEKAKGLSGSAMGVVGLETAFAALYTGLVKTGKITLFQLMRLMHDRPAGRFHIGGGIEVGQPADLAVFDLEKAWVVDPATFASKGRSTPFEGMRVNGYCRMTMKKGQWVWQDLA